MSELLLSRRRFCKLGMLAAGASLIPYSALEAFCASPSSERSLRLYNVRTGESLDTVYWSQGQYLSEPLAEINYILRDHRADEVRSIDTHLLDVLFSICNRLKSRDPLHILSGYRSPSTNALLRRRRRGVAKNSLHIYGKAVDISMPGCGIRSLRKVAKSLQAGGVGYYPRYSFIHVDVGPIRYWRRG